MYNRIVILTLILTLSVFTGISSQSWSQAHADYIQQYKLIAIREMERSGVPASITLAQGLLESGAGSSWLAVEGNNHFGIKCGSDWYGETIYKKDDDRNARGDVVLSCFRKYDTPDASFVAHSDFLRHPDKPWYQPLFELNITDYSGWAKGLLQAGYATNPEYPQLLIGIIERYALQQYDAGNYVAPPVANIETVFLYINGLPYTTASAGETLTGVASRTGVSARQLIKYNDGLKDDRQNLKDRQIIFLKQKKWNNMESELPYHQVMAGETMLDISQMYGISLFWLYYKNRLKEGMEPAPGSQIRLRGARVKQSPGLATGNEVDERPGEESDETYMDWPLDPPVNPVLPDITELPERATIPETETVPVVTVLTYTVQKGDTLWNISQRHNLSVNDLKLLNGLSNNTISIGQVLRLSQ